MSTDFKSSDEMWKWILDHSETEFRFLVDDFGFEQVKHDVTPAQCSVEYQKDDERIGIWIEYGTRPEVFVETHGKQMFTNQLISKQAPELMLPVEDAVFGKRVAKEDYCAILAFYAVLIKKHCRVIAKE